MADLPRLPDTVLRKLALLWDALVEKHGFTGEHLKWTETRKRRIVSGASPPPRNLHDRTELFIRQRTGRAGPIYAHSDTIGISETGVLAVERFAQLAGEYFSLWVAEQGPRSDVFTTWLVEIRALVADEVAQLWTERGDWFQRVCRASLDTALTPSVGQWRSGARDLEINDLEMQRLKLNNAELRQKIARLDAIAEWVTESGEAEQSKIPEILAPESRATLREPKQRNGETTGAPQKATKPRTHLEPRPDLLVNPDATLSRLRAAEALGIAPRTLDRWVKDKKLTPFGAGLRKRFKAKDLQRAIDQKLSDKRDKK